VFEHAPTAKADVVGVEAQLAGVAADTLDHLFEVGRRDDILPYRADEAMVEGMRRVSSSRADPRYFEDLTAMTLRGVGVPRARAVATVHRAAARLEREAPRLFPWWRLPPS
jgi:hypothetical protein